MRIQQAMDFCERAIPKQQMTLLVGKPGVGKSVGLRDVVVNRLKMQFVAECCTLQGPEYVMGYPYRLNGTAGHAPYGHVAAMLEATEPTVWLWDELGGATETFQKALLRAFQFREFGGRKLPDCVHLVAATNDVTHGAGVLGMVEPLKDRFATIIEVEPHIEDTCSYAIANDWAPWIWAFLRNAQEHLCDWKPERSMKRGGATPRGWAALAELERNGLLDGEWQAEVAAGCVGKVAGIKALAFRDLQAELPDIAMIRLQPDTAPVPSNPSAQFLVGAALAATMDGNNFGQTVTYLKRLPKMIRAFSIKDSARAEDSRRKDGKLAKGYHPLQSSPHFAAWVCSEDGRSIMTAAA